MVGLYEREGDNDPKLTPSGEKFDDRAHGKLGDLIKESAISFKFT